MCINWRKACKNWLNNMLYELYVENFAIISQMRLSLGLKLNALTGETGTGKSLVIDAVSLLIGARATDSFIRSGYDRCVIEGVFTRPFSAELDLTLQKMGLTLEDDTLILSRELIRGGRSHCRLNGRNLSLGQLRILGRLLLNIHGQMEHMLLLEEGQQLLLLDNYGGLPLLQIKKQVEENYTQMKEKQKFFDNYEQNKAKKQERMAVLSVEIKELEKAALKQNEEDELRRESQRLSQAEKLLALSATALHELSKNSGAAEALSMAAEVLRQIIQIDEQAQSLAERVESLYYEVEDAARELADYAEAIGTDAHRLDELESRLALLSRLKKKYGGESAHLMNYLNKARFELNDLEEQDYSGGKTEKALKEAKEAYEKSAKLLSAARLSAATKLAAAINKELQLLCMNHASFRIELSLQPPSATGLEKACYMIRTNEGEDYRPVALIASGGELSRIVLAMKVILAQLDSVPTLVFDEVDSGLGGLALNAVAQRLAYVGETTQAIVVTHAPVMAAAANLQLHVSKHISEGRTEIMVRKIEGAERVEELARMIAGENISEITRSQARELLAQFNQ
ncbi:MAG: DNA repair protein RecN, partial [Firmicutes bacterium]|nr:DNA repair protein RecN [Bacillota bacterium]